MAKNKNKGNVVQMLSPENFIRKRARSLPIYECFVNKNWQMSQMVNLVVARQHTSGNITAGVFLVDHACLGVKGTFWIFNVSMTEYQRFVKKFVDIDDGINKIDYALAHNIVYAGIEFAADYEFKPHKDFTSVSQYILEEDTDDIPVIEIECGIDGCPAYMQGPMHTDKMSQQVVAHLERVAGPGNYYLMNGVGNITNNDGFGIGDEDDEGDEDDQFSNMTFDEKSKEFF
ncbi:MAG: hypothetical protein KKA07_05300 [Bacteroidetes bacterium]|nr:hypothetical protein [Bacteroidota bacterium]